jgi:DNA/RNA endonuclease G (NUC1)
MRGRRWRRHWYTPQAVTPRLVSGAQFIGKGRVWVPAQLHKLVYDAGANRAWTHWVENDNDARAGKRITYRDQFLPRTNPGD